MFTIEEFKRRRKEKHMYSPKIDEDLIADLYKLARSQKIPMTKLVNRIIVDYLQKNGIINKEGGTITYEPKIELGGLQGTETPGLHQGDPGALWPSVLHEAKKR